MTSPSSPSSLTTTTTTPITSSSKIKSQAHKIQAQQQTQQNKEEDQFIIINLERKIRIATEGLVPYVVKKLKSLDINNNNIIGRQNIETICNHLIAITAEINPTLSHKKNILKVLCYLSEHHNNLKSFKHMTRSDILAYLDSLRTPEASDPQHKWIGTYNLRQQFCYAVNDCHACCIGIR